MELKELATHLVNTKRLIIGISNGFDQIQKELHMRMKSAISIGKIFRITH